MRPRAGRKDRGQSLAEFALVIPIFILVFLGIAEGGYYVVATTAVSHATHEGARLGVLADTSLTNLKNRVISAARPVASVQTDDIKVCVRGRDLCTQTDYEGRSPGDRLYVRTTYDHKPLLSYVFAAISFPANAEAELWVEEKGST